MAIRWLEEIDADAVSSAGGKGASLGELVEAGLPVPPAFVVTADTYRQFIEEAGIADELFTAVDVDTENSAALAEAANRAAELITETPMPDPVREEILKAFDELATRGPDGEVREASGGARETAVAVRSSATAEDLPEASFAGQQETFLGISREDVIDRVRDCWASLFTQRAIYYRGEQGFSHREVDIAVVVQRMIDAEKSGVLFTSHPSTGDPVMVVEAAWGLGEAVVAGEVSPDNYVIDRSTGEVVDVTVAEKNIMYVMDPETGAAEEQPVPEDRRRERVLSGGELDRLLELGNAVEDHYGTPQDVEWGIADGTVYMLQSRPVTTIREGSDGDSSARIGRDDDAEAESEVLLRAIGASPGQVSGPVRIVRSAEHLDKVGSGDIIVTEMTTPDMVPAMRRAVGIVTDEGGMTSHAAIVSRELGVPAVVGAGNATTLLEDGQVVTINGERGTVMEGRAEVAAASQSEAEGAPVGEPGEEPAAKPMTGTEVLVNVSIPHAAERAAATGADGVGLLRLEHLVLSLDETPERFIENHGGRAYEDEIVRGVRTVADAFYPRTVRVRTIDAPTDEFRGLEGGDDEPDEPNPMLGYRGIRRSLDRPEVFKRELTAFARLYDMGYDNLEVMFPLVNDGADVRAAREQLSAAGIDPEKRSWGVMIETPASALSIEDLVAEGIDFASFGTNDLTQYTLAVDRNNELVADRYDELHPAVLTLIERTIAACREAGVHTSICGQAGSKPAMVEALVEAGITSISANIDAVRNVQQTVKRVEQRLILESIRGSSRD